VSAVESIRMLIAAASPWTRPANTRQRTQSATPLRAQRFACSITMARSRQLSP